MKSELIFLVIFEFIVVYDGVFCVEETSQYPQSSAKALNINKNEKLEARTFSASSAKDEATSAKDEATSAKDEVTSVKSAQITRSRWTSEKITTTAKASTAQGKPRNGGTSNTDDKDTSKLAKSKFNKSGSVSNGQILPSTAILREKNEHSGFDPTLYTIIAACVAVAFGALCVTIVVILKANKRGSMKSRLSTLDQRHLHNVEICMTGKKDSQNDVLYMSFGGIPPNGEIWREIKSSTPTVF